jgi:hypothetical protein
MMSCYGRSVAVPSADRVLAFLDDELFDQWKGDQWKARKPHVASPVQMTLDLAA